MELRNKITVIVPCYNEEATIESCLKSVSWADEILVVDSFSSDRTLDIAKRYTSFILQHEYINSAAQKNWAIPKATHDWILIIDADERVTPELRNEIVAILSKDMHKDAYWIYRNNYILDKKVNNTGWGKDSVLRLIKKSKARYEEKSVHAEVQLKNTDVLKGRLEHRTVLSITQWVNKINRYSSWKAEDKFQKRLNFPIIHLLFRPFWRFVKDFIFRKGILDGWRGFLIASLSAFSELIMIAKVIFLQHNKRNIV
jgi:glycosyltransferase involved in cell wall biosynthesis